MSAPPAWKNIVSGSVAGTASILVCHPMDTVRTRLQTNRNIKGVVDCVRTTLAAEGVRGFYKGMSFPLAAQSVYKAIMFYTFGAVGGALRARSGLRGADPLPLSNIMLAGSCAGGVNSLVVTPVELVRNRLMVQYVSGTNRLYSGPVDIVRAVCKEEGLTGMWRGLRPTLMRDIPGVGCWYLGFECTLRTLSHQRQQRQGAPGVPSFGERLFAGAVGGVGFWTVALPFDAVKSVIQITPGQLSTWQCVKRLWQEGGLRRFYRGAPVAFGRGIPGAAVVFATFGEVMRRLP